MTSLSEVYEGGVNTVASRRQRLLGLALFAVGTVMVVGAIPLATTEVSAWLGIDVFGARQFAGILAGLGLPAVFVGIFAVLPASGPTRAAGAIGSALAVFGVILFSHAYPYRWISNDPQLALVTAVVYVTGTLLTFWCLFIAVATFKTRNDPGGTARVEITDEGRVRVISAGPQSVPGFGSVGLFGNDPDGDVPTQTNDDSASDDILAPEPTSDGGTAILDTPATTDATTDEQFDAEVIEAAQQRGRPDEYCGNCTHFEYVRADGELAPYCGLHRDVMADMDACEEWQQNR